MRRRTGWAMVLRALLLMLLSSLAWAQVGTSAQPHPNDGPLGQWVSNGRWAVRVETATVLNDMNAYRSLDWGPLPKDHFSKVERLTYQKGGKAVLLEVELKNLTSGTGEIGHEVPVWTVRCDDGQEVPLRGIEHTAAARHLKTALPAKTRVGAGETLEGSLVFFLPKNRTPAIFFFKAPGRVERFAGKTESLVVRLRPAAKEKVTALVAQYPDAEWSSNQTWKIRLTDFRLIKDSQAYQELPWTSRLSPSDRKKHFNYVKRTCLDKGGTVALLKLDFKNLGKGKNTFGYDAGVGLTLIDQSGKEHRLAGVYQQTLAWGIKGGMPKAALMNSGARSSGYFGFFLPKGVVARSFLLKPVVKKKHGSSVELEIP